MPPSRQRVMWCLFVAGLSGLILFFWQFDNVFPAASIDLRLSKREISERAGRFAERMGYKMQGAVSATTFGSASYQKTFLEYELPMSEANALMRSELPIWSWRSRFCRPLALEECNVAFTTVGRLSYWYHEIERERALPDVSHEEALRIALAFAEKEGDNRLSAAGTPDDQAECASLAPHVKLVEEGDEKQPKRTDHHFTFEDQSMDYKGAKLRTRVTVSGNVVTSYSNFLHVPDSFDRKYNRIRSYNSMLKSVATGLFALVCSALAFVYLWALSTGRVRWRLSLIMGALFFLVDLADTWNNFPSIVYAYDTTREFGAFLVDELFSSFWRAAMAGLGAAVMVGGVEAVYRVAFPGKLSFESLCSVRGLRSPQVFYGLLAGILVSGMQLGWVAAFYLVGPTFGVWIPLEVRDVSIISSIVPAFSSFAVGLTASTSEEFLYRVLCLVLFQRLTRNFWVANFIQAVGWALMHSDYPQEPAYARGIELTIVGVFFGWLLRRYGLLPCVVSHFVYDALLGVTPLLSSGNYWLAISGVGAFCLPIVWLGASWWRVKRHRFLEEETGLVNSAFQLERKTPVQAVEQDVRYHYTGLGRRWRSGLVFGGILGLLLVLVPVPSIEGGVKLAASRDNVLATAKSYLARRGINPEGWVIAPYMTENVVANEIQYGYEKEGFQKTKQVMEAARYPILWWVRFYKPGQREQYDVIVNPSGQAIGLRVVKDDDAPGKSLSPEEARKLAQDYLKGDRPEMVPFEFETSQAQKRKNRTDYRCQFNVPQYKLGEAELKVSVGIVGDMVSFASVLWQVPESWIFEREKETWRHHLSRYSRMGLAVVLVVALIIWLVGMVRGGVLYWRPGIFTGLVLLAVSLAAEVNNLPRYLAYYDTDVPPESFATSSAVGVLSRELFSGTAVILIATFAYGAWRLLRPGESLLAAGRVIFRPAGKSERAESRELWMDSLIIGYFGSLMIFGTDRLFEWLAFWFSPSAPIASFSPVVEVSGSWSAAAFSILSGIRKTILSVVAVPLAAGFYARFLSRRFVFPLVLLVVASIGYSAERYWQDFAIGVVQFGLGCGAAYFLVGRLARNNVLAYAVLALVSFLLLRAGALFVTAGPAFGIDAAIIATIALAPLGFGLWRILCLAATSEERAGEKRQWGSTAEDEASAKEDSSG